MSLSDYIKYLRAMKGGLTPWEIAEGSGVPAGEIHFLEVKHRRVGEDDETLEKLAGYFEVPVDELKGRREAYRKRLTSFLVESEASANAVTLKLNSGEELEGSVAWYAREAIALTPTAGGEVGSAPFIVQRGWVDDWRRADAPQWEVAHALEAGSEQER